jgi:non-specific serine/threonine protein kinase
MAGIPGKRLLICIVAFLLGITWIVFKSLQWAAGLPETGKKEAVASPLPPARPEKSIVVLPFVNMSPEEGQDYFCDGMTEEIITDLSHVHDLIVISRSSAMTFKGTKKTIPEIAQTVNVRYVLEGSVRKADNDLRIAAQLIDATDDAHLWAEKYAGTLKDVFDIQEKLSRSIVDSIKLRLGLEQIQKIAKRQIDNVQAYDYYLRARRDLWIWTEEALERALQHFQNALKITGENAVILIGIGEVYAHYYHSAIRMDEATLKKAEEYAKRGLALDLDSSRAHYLLGSIEHARGNLRAAYNYYEQSLSLDANDTDCLFGFVFLLSMVFGKPSTAIPWARKGLEIDPLTPKNQMLLAWVDWTQGRFELAYESIQKYYKMEPHSVIALFYYIHILIWNSKWEEAFTLIDQWIDREPQSVWALLNLFLKDALKETELEPYS